MDDTNTLTALLSIPKISGLESLKTYNKIYFLCLGVVFYTRSVNITTNDSIIKIFKRGGKETNEL